MIRLPLLWFINDVTISQMIRIAKLMGNIAILSYGKRRNGRNICKLFHFPFIGETKTNILFWKVLFAALNGWC